MGNYLSCTIAAAPAGGASVVRLVLPSGEVQRIRLGSSSFPATAAEVMLEHPGHFVTFAASVRVGGRFAALPADEELELGGFYVVLPMKRAGSVITASDATALFLAATSARQSSGRAAAAASSGVKVVPEASCQSPAASGTGKESLRSSGDEEEREDQVTTAAVEAAMSMARYRAMSRCRSRKPALETITEETVRQERG